MNSVPLSLYTWLGMPYLRGCDDNTPLYNIISLASKKSLDRAKMILGLLGFIHLIVWEIGPSKGLLTVIQEMITTKYKAYLNVMLPSMSSNLNLIVFIIVHVNLLLLMQESHDL